jgi:hypothetical protein
MRILAAVTILFLGIGIACAADKLSNADILRVLTDRKALVQVTSKRMEVSPEMNLLCNDAWRESVPDHRRLTANRSAFIHVFVTSEGAAAMKDSAAVFPVGTLIFKQKFATATAKEPELYTGMLKREKGYNPDCGDWEFFTVAGNGKVVTARGRIDSCIECHKEYPKSDFVTKVYK